MACHMPAAFVLAAVAAQLLRADGFSVINSTNTSADDVNASAALAADAESVTAAGARSAKFAKRGPPSTWGGDPSCIPQTGRRCFNGHSDCEPWVACSEDFYCVCHDWGCADSRGVCRPVHNQFLDPVVRIAPSTKKHFFLEMPADGVSRPQLMRGYPKDTEPQALWSFLLQPDNRTVMITTKLNRAQTDARHPANGFFLTLPPPPWKEDSLLLAPVQRRAKDSLGAAWHVIQRPAGRVAFRHVWSQRFLCLDPSDDQISSCSDKHCGEDGMTIDFNLWPDKHLPLWEEKEETAAIDQMADFFPKGDETGAFPKPSNPEGPPNPFNVSKPWEERIHQSGSQEAAVEKTPAAFPKPSNPEGPPNPTNVSKPWEDRINQSGSLLNVSSHSTSSNPLNVSKTQERVGMSGFLLIRQRGR